MRPGRGLRAEVASSALTQAAKGRDRAGYLSGSRAGLVTLADVFGSLSSRAPLVGVTLARAIASGA